MGEKAAEKEASSVPDQLEAREEEEASREEGEGKVHAGEEANVLAEKHSSKNKPGRVQSVFSLVRNQIRAQSSPEVSRTGTGVQQVSRQLDTTNAEQEVFEETSPRQEVQEVLEETPAGSENSGTKDESTRNECVDLLQELLKSLEALKKEVVEELHHLRRESRSNTDKVLQELQNTNPGASVSVPPLPGAPKRRLLRRTLTGTAPRNAAAQALRPRCMSEPVGSRSGETASAGNGVSGLLPSVGVPQRAKKPASQPRANKP